MYEGRAPVGVALAPGRVNLIGEHTDYNDGFVLPMAIDRYVAAAFAPNGLGLLRAHSTTFREAHQTSLEHLEEARSGTWFDYVVGVVRMLLGAGVSLDGMDIAITSDLPSSSGLSSSAALELATARAAIATADGRWEPIWAAKLCQRAENEHVGVQCGIMDQLAVAVAQDGCALLVDCRDLTVTPVPIPATARVVVMDTGAPRDLAATGYNQRRASCESAVAVLRQSAPHIRALRDVEGAQLEAARGLLDPLTFRRAQHVVAECARPPDMARALREGDLERCGSLMTDSHWSLRDLYEVSCAELDLMTDLAGSHRACYGARLTGAGFGGSAVALVEAELAGDFAGDVLTAYRRLVDLPAALYVCRPVGGVALA